MSEETRGKVYRKKAMDERVSIYSLDELVTVTRPVGWIALLAVGVALAFALAWSIFGRLPQMVQGQGIMLRGGRLMEVVSLGSGRVAELKVRPGDLVRKGEVVGAVQQDILESRIQGERKMRDRLREQYERIRREQTAFLDAQMQLIEREEETTGTSIREYAKAVEELRKVVRDRAILLKKGLITEMTYIEAQNELDRAIVSLLTQRSNLTQISAKRISIREQVEQNVFSAYESLLQAENTLETSEIEYGQTARLVSENDARVVSVQAVPGQAITAQSSVVLLEPVQGAMKAIVFAPARQGNLAREGMSVFVSPDGFPPDQYGYIKAKVMEVSLVPVTSQGMMALLQNSILVESLTAQGAPMQIVAQLEADPGSFTGYAWTSSGGPKTEIPSGTIVKAQIIVQELPPITLVVPLLKKLFGIQDILL